MGSKEFQELAMNAVFRVNPNIAISEMFVVWMVKVLQNNKALISAQSTDNYYEVTYNGDKKELYVDEYIKNTNTCLNVNDAYFIKENSQLVIIDSGAHSFQKGTKVDWVEYTKQYAEFIKEFDEDKVVGYFEMDVDNILGYEKVLELRKILESVSDKIIPVWHKNRGIQDFKDMCKKYQGKVVAITGFKNEDIKDEQYIMFLKYAKKYNCKVHCLGMTRKKVLDRVPFDYCDSSTWVQQSVYGRINGLGKVSREMSRTNREQVMIENYKQFMQMQEKYEQKWRNVNK